MKLDKEYSTMFFKEVEYLKSVGVKHSFSKYIDGIKIYKYSKTPQLFKALFDFYENKLFDK